MKVKKEEVRQMMNKMQAVLNVRSDDNKFSYAVAKNYGKLTAASKQIEDETKFEPTDAVNAFHKEFDEKFKIYQEANMTDEMRKHGYTQEFIDGWIPTAKEIEDRHVEANEYIVAHKAKVDAIMQEEIYIEIHTILENKLPALNATELMAIEFMIL